MEANGLDLLVQKVQERLFPQRTAEARELLKQGMRIGGPMSRVPGEPMTSYISRRRRCVDSRARDGQHAVAR